MLESQQNKSVFTVMLQDRSADFIVETRFIFSIFDNYPVNPGHALIIPKRQILSVSELSPLEWSELQGTIESVKEKILSLDLLEFYKARREVLESSSKAAKSINLERQRYHLDAMLEKLKALPSKSPSGFNIGINDGRSAGRTIDHLHIHLIPRFDGDMLHPEGGIRLMFPDLGNYTSERPL